MLLAMLVLVLACVGESVAGDASNAHGAAADCRPHGLKPAAGHGAQTRAQEALASKVESADACRAVPGVKVQSLGDLWASLVGDASIGGKRFETPVPPGAPTGTVMVGPQGVDFDFHAIAGEGLKAFQLFDLTHKRRLLFVRTPRAIFHVPGLDRDGRYAWALVTGARTYQAKFDLLGAADEAEVKARLRTLERAGLDPESRDFYEAAIYDDEGLYAERDALLARLRAQLAH